MNWHVLAPLQLFESLSSRPSGLHQQEVDERLHSYGKNELTAKKKRPLWLKFLMQFKDFMILVLLAAAILAGVMGDLTDTMIIVVIVLVNAVIGFVQEYRADKAMEALKNMAAPSSLVIRDGKNKAITATDLVPGDIVLLEAGQVAPADIRLTEAHNLKLQEAALTGESQDIEKHHHKLTEEDMPLGDRKNMVFKGTFITNGRGKGIVVHTGMQTEMGKIAQMLSGEDAITPLQRRMAAFGKSLSLIVVGVCMVVFITGYLRGEDTLKILLTSISLAVAAIPESLPAVITISLALGAKRMVDQLVLIRKLPAVETLGSVTYVCTDKTGTLTQNKMQVEKAEIVRDSGEDISELFYLNLALSNDVNVAEKGDIVGDTTEKALYEYAADHNFQKEELLRQYPRVAELPFDSVRKRMSTVHEYNNKYLVLVKGAVESIIERAEDPDKKSTQNLCKEAEQLAAKGYRVLVHGCKIMDRFSPGDPVEVLENDLRVLGFTGIIDPIRPEARQAVSDCYSAGIIPVMITGDHPETARHIAQQIGIISNGKERHEETIITGRALSRLSWEEFLNRVERIRVYARVSPEQKLDIVKALQQKGQYVAMTGDGINDAPALKNANIGIAMGITGTDVSKEAAHMILMDDNFATIAHAVKEGRRIYDNVRKFIKYTLTSNAGEIWVIFLAPLVGLPIPLLPVHLLWINLVTDGLPGLALSNEKAEKNIMDRPPRHPKESIFARGLGTHVLWVGLLMGAVTLGTQAVALKMEDVHWQTIVFNVLCISQMGHVLAVRSDRETSFKTGVFTNKALIGAVLLTLFLQIIVTYVDFLQPIFHTQSLTVQEFLVVGAVSTIVFFAVELEKVVIRKKY